MKLQASDRTPLIVSEQIVLHGAVQGIGLRPAVARWAQDCGVSGTATNGQQGVTIQAEGSPSRVRQFVDGLLKRLPLAANVEYVERMVVEPAGCNGFEIEVNLDINTPKTRVPLDAAVCQKCLEEVSDSSDCRAGYALASCAECGPRYSIIKAMPFQREYTAMAKFTRCQNCCREYESIADRRFHAETMCCPDCGPQVWCADCDGGVVARRGDAVDVAIRALVDGKIVALRGIGGYQLLVDATKQSAVERLRHRKQRQAKPLAVMVRSLKEAEQIADLDETERAALVSAGNPVVVVRQRDVNLLASKVNPGMNTVGVMLATTPLHWELITGLERPIIATSGNSEGCPIEYDAADSQQRLAKIADVWLHHDRTIVRPIDDSVVRVIGNRAVAYRLGRGLAPLPLDLDVLRPVRGTQLPPMLAVGGQMKSAIAISNGRQAVLGPHIGDLEGAATRERWIEHVSDLSRLYGAEPELLVCDQHPGYFTTDWAQRQDIPHIAVQHHHAHVVASMVEHQWLDREVLGFAFDGTGYGTDGTIWGGEALLATADDFKRVAHLRPFRLAGGDAAVRQPWRVAVELVCEAVGAGELHRLGFVDLDSTSIDRVLGVLEHDRFSPRTTSMGRLFDGVAALVLGTTHVDFEAQAAMQLEAVCDFSATGQYEFSLRDGPCIEMDWRPVVAAICDDRRCNVASGVIAMRFHRAVANAVVSIAQRFPAHPVALDGGVFQNRVLTEFIAEQWSTSVGLLGLPGRIPPGDGGLAAGQLAVATARFYREGV